MIETTIHFIISLIEIFVNFLSSIEINLFGFTFSFYSFILASILILVFVGGLVAVTRKAGVSFFSVFDRASRVSNSSKTSSEDSPLNNRGK